MVETVTIIESVITSQTMRIVSKMLRALLGWRESREFITHFIFGGFWSFFHNSWRRSSVSSPA